MTARPVGAFIIDGELSWRRAAEVNRIVLGGQVVASRTTWFHRVATVAP